MRNKMDCKVPDQQKQQIQQQQQQQKSANKLSARKPQQQQQQQPQQQESSDDDDLTTTERKNLEFAQKLGYSEQSIHTALTRLGSEAKQNELLAELIKLTADAPRPPTSSNSNCNNNHVSPSSSNSISHNNTGSLRHIVIDGSNVALSHGNNTIFSCRGIRICVDWFRQRGHRHITAFVPNWRKELANNNITEQELLYELEQERVLVFTPSRHLDGKRVSCYDDRFILKLAVETDGIVVSNDNYRDLLLESNEYRKVVQERLLMYSFVDDIFMPPEDPLGRSGPTLDVLLRAQQTQQKMSDAQQQLCPYGKKCTYGQKCKFRHQTAPLQLQRLPLQVSHSAPLHSNGGQQLLANSSSSTSNNAKLAALARTKSNTIEKISQQQQQQQQQLCNSFNNQLDLDAESSQQLNRHKKLQRQAPTSAFRLLLPPGNNNNNSNNNNFHHQYLTRTPSAPLTDQHQAAQLSPSMPAHNLAHLSASDSRINEELHTAQASREEQRRLLRYHLSNLFPQHQVHAVLQLYPDETNAKTICAAIINLFPHN